MADEPKSVWDLKRNDLEGAFAFLKRAGRGISADALRVLVNLQDDPQSFFAEARRRGLID